MNVLERLSVIDAGDGIVLELLDEGHAEATFALIRKNLEHLSEWLPWVGSMQTIENFRSYIHRTWRQAEEGTDYGYIIKHENTLVGRIGIHYIQQQNRSGAIGYWLGKEFEGKGIITKACSALIDHCFTVLNLNRIEIKCGTANRKSAAIPERLGFTKEGVLRKAECVNGAFLDLALYSLLKEEWVERF